MTAPDRPLRVRARAALVLVVVFAAGAAAGIGVTRLRPPPGPRGGGIPGLAELDLTQDQEREARAVFAKHQRELDAVLRDVYPRVRSIGEEIEADLRPILTEAQRRKMDDAKRKHGGPPSPVPPPR